MPNQILRAGRTFLVFGITAILSVFVTLIILGSIPQTPKITTTQIAQPRAQPSDALTLSVPASTHADPHTPLVARALPQTNATRVLAKELAAEIIKRNPAGPGPKGSQRLTLLKPTEAVDALAAQALEKFNPKDFHQTIPTTDIHIVADSKEAFAQYFNNLSTAITTHFANVDFAPKTDLSAMNFPRILAAYRNLIAALKRIEVPAALTALHQEELSLVLGQQRLIKYLAAYDTDPLSALLALNMQQQLEEDSSSLGNSFRVFINNQGLAL